MDFHDIFMSVAIITLAVWVAYLHQANAKMYKTLVLILENEKMQTKAISGIVNILHMMTRDDMEKNNDG